MPASNRLVPCADQIGARVRAGSASARTALSTAPDKAIAEGPLSKKVDGPKRRVEQPAIENSLFFLDLHPGSATSDFAV
jgi:hypothetical protein